MFVFHALVLTFITTPLTLFIYPAHCRVEGGPTLEKASTSGTGAAGTSEEFIRSKFTVVLDGMEQLPIAMTLTQLLQPHSARSDETTAPYLANKHNTSVEVLRLMELTDRTSAILRSQTADTLIRNDPVLSVFRTFGRLNHFSVSAYLSVINYDEFSTHVANHARESGSQAVVIPWPLPSHVAEGHNLGLPYNPFDTHFFKTSEIDEATSLLLRSQFVGKVFANSPLDVALFIDRGLSTDSGSTIYPHVFLPFFGGPDDRLALSFVMQLCMHEEISATIVRMHRLDPYGPTKCPDLTVK